MTTLNDQKKIYIAHSLSLRDWVADKIIPRIESFKTVRTRQSDASYIESPAFSCINPFRDRLERFKGMTVEEIRENNFWVQPRLIVQRDLRDVFNSHGMMVINTDGPTYGSTYEASIFFSRTNGLGFIVFVVKPELVNHPWLNYFSHAVVDNIDDAIEALGAFFYV